MTAGRLAQLRETGSLRTSRGQDVSAAPLCGRACRHRERHREGRMELCREGKSGKGQRGEGESEMDRGRKEVCVGGKGGGEEV